MTAVAGALGSVIGYVGAEVAEPTVFERLLWPQRFYNYTTPRTLFLSALTMPMGGPLHKAALETLDAIRENGLYRGARRGHMLGTAFYHNTRASYVNRTASDSDSEIRNGFWVEVLKMVDQGGRGQWAYHDRRSGSSESLPKQLPMSRAKQLLFTLSFSNSSPNSSGHAVSVSEDEVTGNTILGVVFSELSTIIFAVVVGIWQKAFWLSGLLVLPLLVKLISLVVSVRRESLVPLPGPHHNPTSIKLQQTSKDTPKAALEATAKPADIYEVISPSIGFVLIRGQAALILPFFRHYGHPLRETHYDRFREICGIVLIYIFILYFPGGLIALLWMDPNTQYLWLGYQSYAIFVMHISRLFGFGGTARTEERIARLLQDGKEVCLHSGEAKVWVSLDINEVDSVAMGRQMVNSIVTDHARGRSIPVDAPYP
jgi:hypothetical protein